MKKLIQRWLGYKDKEKIKYLEALNDTYNGLLSEDNKYRTSGMLYSFWYCEAKLMKKKDLINTLMVAIRLIKNYEDYLLPDNDIKLPSKAEARHRIWQLSQLFTGRHSCEYECENCNEWTKREASKIIKIIKETNG